MVSNRVLLIALSTALFAPACGAVCESREDSYSGTDTIPYSDVTAAEIVAAGRISLVKELAWVPYRAPYEGGYGSTPPLPFEGLTQVEIEVTPLSDVLTSDYTYYRYQGCYADAVPEAPARITIRTSDGALNEDVRGRLSGINDTAHVAVKITEFKGRIKEYFDSFEPPMAPKLWVNIESDLLTLHLRLDRLDADHPSHEFIRLP